MRVQACAAAASRSRDMVLNTRLNFDLVALFQLLHFPILVAQLRLGVLQFLLADLPESIDLVLHTPTQNLASCCCHCKAWLPWLDYKIHSFGSRCPG